MKIMNKGKILLNLGIINSGRNFNLFCHKLKSNKIMYI
jgi:hypothetical protein